MTVSAKIETNLMQSTCGAKTRAGVECKTPAMPNGRCRMHGGASTGPKDQTGNANARRHGIYSRRLSADELVAFETIEIGSVDHELRLTRIRLARVLAAETKAADQPEIEEIVENEDGGLAIARKSRKSKVRNYVGIIDRLIGRIESLEKTRQYLASDSGGSNDAVAGFETVPYDSEK